MLVEMLGRFVPTQADLRQVQPIVCINCSDTPARLLQSLSNLYTEKAFAAGIDAANPDKNGLFGRSFGPLCDNLGSEEIELVQVLKLSRGRDQPSACCLNWCIDISVAYPCRERTGLFRVLFGNRNRADPAIAAGNQVRFHELQHDEVVA